MGIFFLRLFVGLRLLYGVIDNVFSWEQMIEFSHFLEQNSFPVPLVSAITSVYAQFICGLMILLGFKIRITSVIMIFNFLIALIFFHIKIGDSIEGMTPALAMLFGSLTFLFTGSQKFSIDEYLNSKR